MPHYVAAQLCRTSKFLAYDNAAYLPLTSLTVSSFPLTMTEDTVDPWGFGASLQPALPDVKPKELAPIAPLTLCRQLQLSSARNLRASACHPAH